jgi:hypothetical protein
MSNHQSSSRQKAVVPVDLDAGIQARIDAEAAKFREKLFAAARAEAAAERARVAAAAAAAQPPAQVVDFSAFMAKMEQIDRRLDALTARRPSRPPAPATRKGRRTRAASTRELTTEGEANVSESYSGTALDDIRALLDLKEVVRIPDVIEAKIYNHLGKPVTPSNARRFLEKLEANKEAFCGKEFTRHIPGPGWRYVWAKTPKLLAEAIAGKRPRDGEGRDGEPGKA